jgi:hypothetical protein
MPRHCDYCHETFEPRQENQRFCCGPCAHAWFAEERREAVRAWRAEVARAALARAEERQHG